MGQPKTQMFELYPWVGGLNTNPDESAIQPNQLVRADNLIFGVQGSRKKREGIDKAFDDATSGSVSIIGAFDFWYGASNSRDQVYVAVTADKKIHTYNPSSGARSADLFGGTAWPSNVTVASFSVLNNLLIISVDGANNVMKKFDGATVSDLGVNTGTGDTTSASPILTNVPGTTKAYVGAKVTGAGIPADTQVIKVLGTDVTMSANATATATGVALTFTTTPPLAAFTRIHLGRVVANNKDNPDRLEYSSTFNPEEWGGYGDSGAIDIFPGDGDPVGISGIFHPFKGTLHVGKKTKLYRIEGQSPETISVRLVSDGLGVESHNSIISIEDTDVAWLSSRGIHSLAATQTFGDMQSKFLSSDIQRTFNERFTKSRLKLVKGGYLNQINSIAFALTDDEFGTQFNNCIYLYNIEQQAWYRWADVSCQSLFVAIDGDKKRFYLGSDTGRLYKTQTGNPYDVTEAGAPAAIQMDILTGRMSLDNSRITTKAFKYFYLLYKPEGTHTITATVSIDGFSGQANAFSDTTGSDLMGVSFVLDYSILGSESPLAPYPVTIDGYGRAVQVRIQQSGINERAEIYGIGIEFESASVQREIIAENT